MIIRVKFIRTDYSYEYVRALRVAIRTSLQLDVDTLISWANTWQTVMLNYAGDAGDGFTQDVAAAYPLIWSGGRRN